MNRPSTVSQISQLGMTLIELMVALAIGAFLMIGAVTVFQQSRTTFRINDNVSRLQENARFALDTVASDVRMAHYWGLTARSAKVLGRARPANPAGIGPTTCGNNWTINLDFAIQGSNNGYAFGCAGVAPVETNSDAFVIRRASEEALAPAALTNNTLYIQSARFQDSQLFAGTTVPAGYAAATSESHRLIVNGYYISRTSTSFPAGNTIPSLRRKTLVAGGTIQDQEVMTGVEDMQVQFGVDTDAIGAANRGAIDRYVNADDPILNPASAGYLPDAEILAVRIWLRMRAERIENGFTDTATYVYADQNVAAPRDNFRRVLISKTIYIRNARPAA
jgi:type IV pilus assembly protein PilW